MTRLVLPRRQPAPQQDQFDSIEDLLRQLVEEQRTSNLIAWYAAQPHGRTRAALADTIRRRLYDENGDQ